MVDPSKDPAPTDPMFAELRRRHPDVEVVLLPSPTPADHPPLAGPGQVRALRSHVDAVLAALSTDLGLDADRTVRLWWQQAHPLCHRRVVRAGFTDETGGRAPVDLLRAAGDALVALGWDARPAADGSPRLRAVAGPVEVVAEATPVALAVRLTSEPVWAAPEALEGAEAAS